MAAVVLVAGGTLGMISALVGLFLGMGLLASLGLWMATGLGVSALAGGFALLPRGWGARATV